MQAVECKQAGQSMQGAELMPSHIGRADLFRSNGGGSTYSVPISERTKWRRATTILSGRSTRRTSSFWKDVSLSAQGCGRAMLAGSALSEITFQGACRAAAAG